MLLEALTERSLHCTPHQTPGKREAKNVIQVRREKRVWTCWLELRASSVESPRDRMEALRCHQFTPKVEETEKRKATEGGKQVGGLQREEEGWQVVDYQSCEPEPCRGADLYESPSCQSVQLGHFCKPVCGRQSRSGFDRSLDNFPAVPLPPTGSHPPICLQRWGSTRQSAARLQARPGERISLRAARVCARARAPPHEDTGHARRAAGSAASGERAGRSRLRWQRLARRCRRAPGPRGASPRDRFSATGRRQRLGGSRRTGRAPSRSEASSWPPPASSGLEAPPGKAAAPKADPR